MPDSNKAEILQSSFIFSRLADDELGGLARLATERSFRADEFIFWDGDAPEWFYIVAEGKVKVIKHSSTGKEFIIAFFSPGEMFGEVAVFENKPYPASAQALQIVNGKVKLISEKYCDGLGACLGECPQGAITIEERAADDFDEEAVKLHLEEEPLVEEGLACGCPSTMVTQFDRPEVAGIPSEGTPDQPSMLSQWPVQLALVPPMAPFLQGTDLVLTADCVPFAYAGFHRDFLREHSLLVACPKLDNFQAQLKKMADILRHSSVKSLTVVHMEVPCCFGLVHMARQAVQLSGRDILFKEATIGIKGDLKS